MEQKAQEEDASLLKFSKEFETAETLLISEVHMLMENRKIQNETSEEDKELPKVFLKTLEYCERFSRFKNKETIIAVRNMLVQKANFHKYEIASLANLCPENSEEAKALIPSLEDKIDNDDLQKVLDDLQTKRSFQC